MRRAKQITGVICFSLGVFFGVAARGLRYWTAPGVPGPGFLPFWLAIGLAVGGVGILLESYWNAPRDFVWFSSRDSLLRVFVLACLTGALAVAIKPLGMLLAIGLYLLIFLGIYIHLRWPLILLIAAGIPLGMHLMFEIWLKVSLPRGFLGF